MRIPLFLLALFIVRGGCALLYSSLIGRRKALIAGLLQATSLPFIVSATQVATQLDVVSQASAAAVIVAGLLSVIILPAAGLALLRREATAAEFAGDAPAPAMPVTVEDRELCALGARWAFSPIRPP